ncbi:hypothetical protein OUZ56_007166 [Daphnia magna]|uniref:Uncharacterized protein n=1 Tax=Daphnia magna TaxID=35525 RepID=A0ABQ9YXT0_9CRUS|nr:hypothetical protein OUZ56_007166 [Daphnia magna]
MVMDGELKIRVSVNVSISQDRGIVSDGLFYGEGLVYALYLNTYTVLAHGAEVGIKIRRP